ncbi:M20/M25/M40 family metallo-hydrolase [Herbiconiux moechotypicola]|uniref:M20 family peptidase n=1 Tax=Herbiconiux moechotypicola TaxID=637393 RepID=A0ABN3D795_9MICO|nr:M20/M25/M40 family metallo-hydrolase [Herbiconiux moechotypicola]MCS5728459.1 M20/M25/M40 family metallo-hydrolase [Herbiconiux moechotypicola]
MTQPTEHPSPAVADGSHDDEASLARFRALLRIPTISQFDPAAVDAAAYDDFADTIERLYPAVHAHLTRELVGGRTLLYRWAGRQTGGPASILLAHYDVVAATDDGWVHPPFSATVTGSSTARGDDRVLWSRGTLDDKGSVVALLEAAERALADGVEPEHDVYLLFGHDEESEGRGAAAVAALLAERGVEIGLVLDEGGAVVEGVIPTVERPIAVVGVSEKGTTTFTLTVEQAGGHASTPPPVTASDRLARAIVRINAHPFPGRLNPATEAMITTVGAHARNPLRFVFTRARWFRPLLVAAFGRIGVDTAAMVRTTTAVTRLSGGLAVNALPERVQAVVNARIAIGSSVARTKARLERVIGDPAVRVEILSANEPARVSQMSGPRWDLLAETIGESYPTAIVTPYVQTGATDSRRFSPRSRSVYRFSPFAMSGDERGTLHAKNERMHVATWFTGIAFYERLFTRL